MTMGKERFAVFAGGIIIFALMQILILRRCTRVVVVPVGWSMDQIDWSQIKGVESKKDEIPIPLHHFDSISFGICKSGQLISEADFQCSLDFLAVYAIGFDGEDFNLKIVLTDKSAERLKRVTTLHVGADITFFANDVPLRTSEILFPLTGGYVFIPNFTIPYADITKLLHEQTSLSDLLSSQSDVIP